MEEVVALGADRLLQVGAGHRDRDQGQVVVVGRPRPGARCGSPARRPGGGIASVPRSSHSASVWPTISWWRCGRVDAALVAVVELGVEERRRLAPPRRPGGGVVGDRGRDPAEQEAGLVRAQLDVRPLAVGVGGGRLAEHPGQPPLARPVHQEALGAGEEVLAARGRQRHRLARSARPRRRPRPGSSPCGRAARRPRVSATQET